VTLYAILPNLPIGLNMETRMALMEHRTRCFNFKGWRHVHLVSNIIYFYEVCLYDIWGSDSFIKNVKEASWIHYVCFPWFPKYIHLFKASLTMMTETILTQLNWHTTCTYRRKIGKSSLQMCQKMYWLHVFFKLKFDNYQNTSLWVCE